MKHGFHLVAWAAMTAVSHPSLAQPAAASPPAKLERVEVTGSLIKRTDRETPAVVQVITRQEIERSGYGSIEELLRANSAIDNAGSVSDGQSSGFTAGVATSAMRGLGSAATLTLINGRRMAPTAVVDTNFGRNTMFNVNNIPRGAIERIEILKDGASALYGSDAIAGVINYVLRKDYTGLEAGARYSAADTGVGATHSASLAYGAGNLDQDRFNVFAGLEMSKRDPVRATELKDRGNLDEHNRYHNLGGSDGYFLPLSYASRYANYYRVPNALSGSTTLSGISVPNSHVAGANYLGTMAGCPDAQTVGKGVPIRPSYFAASTPSRRAGACLHDTDSEQVIISEQERIAGTLRLNVALSSDLNAYADLMLAKTTSTTPQSARAITTSTLASVTAPFVSQTPLRNGSIQRQGAVILPVTHPDNPTRGSARPEAVQLLYRFHDLPAVDISEQKASRFTLGVQGVWGEWDVDSALLYSRADSLRVQTNRLRFSLLPQAIANGSYRFDGRVNTPEVIRSIASDATAVGKADVTLVDLRASRKLFQMVGGAAAAAVGAEMRRETFNANPDENYVKGDYIGNVANSANGSRKMGALFAELSLPVLAAVEVQTALRHEKYSDFGNSTTGKLGAKWAILPSTLMARATAATGFRAPGISQIANSSSTSFRSDGDERIHDPLRCRVTDNPDGSKTYTPLAAAPTLRDCNLTNFTSGIPSAQRPGGLPTNTVANEALKPETSKSFTAGLVFSPSRDVDFALDYWYFHRDNEIRSQLPPHIFKAAFSSPTNPANSQIVRDPNPGSWLPGVPNSGPVLMVLRKFDNFNWTKTAGLDYELNLRMRTEEAGVFRLRLAGTYTQKYLQKILDADPADDLLGTSNFGADVPQSKGSATLNWSRGPWSAFARWNHQDKLHRGSTTNSCLASTSAANQLRQSYRGCFAAAERSYDAGLTYAGFKGWSLSASVQDLTNEYTSYADVPSVFGYWNAGTSGQLGRRFNLSVSYKTD